MKIFIYEQNFSLSLNIDKEKKYEILIKCGRYDGRISGIWIDVENYETNPIFNLILKLFKGELCGIPGRICCDKHKNKLGETFEECIEILKTKLNSVCDEWASQIAKLLEITISDKVELQIKHISTTYHIDYLDKELEDDVYSVPWWHTLYFEDILNSKCGLITFPHDDDFQVLSCVYLVPKSKPFKKIENKDKVSFLGILLKPTIEFEDNEVEFNTANSDEKLKIVIHELDRFKDLWVQKDIQIQQKIDRKEQREQILEWKKTDAHCSKCGKPLWKKQKGEIDV